MNLSTQDVNCPLDAYIYIYVCVHNRKKTMNCECRFDVLRDAHRVGDERVSWRTRCRAAKLTDDCRSVHEFNEMNTLICIRPCVGEIL